MILKLKYPQLFIFLLAALCLPAIAFAQESRQAVVNNERPGRLKERRPDLFRELGLSDDQMQSLRKLNVDRKPIEQQARKRFQEASRELNAAIYSDSVSDAVFQDRMKDFEEAQALLARIKFSNELAVRKLLTPEQLEKFRELRRRFAEARENMGDRPGRRRGQPGLRRLRRANLPPN